MDGGIPIVHIVDESAAVGGAGGGACRLDVYNAAVRHMMFDSNIANPSYIRGTFQILDATVPAGLVAHSFNGVTGAVALNAQQINTGDIVASSAAHAWCWGLVAADDSEYHNAINYLWPAADGGAGTALTTSGAGVLSWAAPAPAAHNILSASHGDTLAGVVVDGDVIIGNVTPRWSRLAIAIPGANVRNVLGIDNAELRPSWKTALDAVNPAAIGVGDAAAPGTSLIFSHRDHQHASPATWTATAHNLLSAIHGDTVTSVMARGDLVRGTAAGWDNLAIGAANRYLHSDATDPTWQQIDHTHIGNVLANQHHNEIHIVNSTGPHAEAGLTIGHVLRASAAAAFSFAALIAADIPQLDHGGLAGLADDDHPQYMTPAEHTAIGNAAPHHAAITLDANADTLLSLTGQALGLDVQTANFAFLGPAAGAPAVPTFRALVAADLPAVSNIWTKAAANVYTTTANDCIIPNAGTGTIGLDAAANRWDYGYFMNLAVTTSIVMSDGATIGQAAGPLLTFDDAGNDLELTGAYFGIGIDPTAPLHVSGTHASNVQTIWISAGASHCADFYKADGINCDAALWLQGGTANDVIMCFGGGDVKTYSGADILVYAGAPGALNAAIYGATGNLWLTAAATTHFGGGTYTWPATDGAAGQLLSTSDGAGTLAWIDPAASAEWTKVGGVLFPTAANIHVIRNTTGALGQVASRWDNVYSVLGDFTGQITSSLAIGTSPFAITSTTKCTNLNADYTDGFHAAQAATANNIVVRSGDHILMAAGGQVDGVDISAHTHPVSAGSTANTQPGLSGHTSGWAFYGQLPNYNSNPLRRSSDGAVLYMDATGHLTFTAAGNTAIAVGATQHAHELLGDAQGTGLAGDGAVANHFHAAGTLSTGIPA